MSCLTTLYWYALSVYKKLSRNIKVHINEGGGPNHLYIHAHCMY